MRLSFSDLFDENGYRGGCGQWSGQEVEISGYLNATHDGAARMLVSVPGACPDCSPVPVAAIDLPGFEGEASEARVTMRGMLSYGFAVDEKGNASFLRIERASLQPEPLA